jgi:hypothetical protein
MVRPKPAEFPCHDPTIRVKMTIEEQRKKEQSKTTPPDSVKVF